MSYFLWVEDFENDPKVTASNVFGHILGENTIADDRREIKKAFKENGVLVELNFQDGLSFISSELKRIDYVILDIDLPAYGAEINTEVLTLLENFENYLPNEDEAEDEISRQKACDELKKIAGFYLYTKLVVEFGFPKQHILFCSNHGENTKSIQEAFKTAKIDLPKIHQKSDSDVQRWVKERYENPYSRLRRGIIEGCRFLADQNLIFEKYHANDDKPVNLDIDNYLSILERFLPLAEPTDKSSIFKLFIRTLAHEWDEAVKPKKLNKKQQTLAFSWIMKITRNWSAHSKVFEHLTEKDVAFFFMVNMRAMFELGSEVTDYERYLLSLFENPVSENKFKDICASRDKISDRSIPLTQSYAALLHKYGTNYEAINFHDLLNELQKNNSENPEFLIQGLYQVFWFLTSYGKVNTRITAQNQTFLNYQFVYFDYGVEEYLFEIGRHTYPAAFQRPNS